MMVFPLKQGVAIHPSVETRGLVFLGFWNYSGLLLTSEPLSRFKAGGSGSITAAFSGLSPCVAAQLQHPGPQRWLADLRAADARLPRINRGLTKGGQRVPSTRALVFYGVLSGRLHEGSPRRQAAWA